MCKLGWPSAIEARTPWITAGVPLSEVGFPMLPTNKDVNSIAGEEEACKKESKRIHEVVFLGQESVIKHTIKYDIAFQLYYHLCFNLFLQLYEYFCGFLLSLNSFKTFTS